MHGHNRALADVQAEDRRLIELRCLCISTGYSGNQYVLRRALERWGHVVSLMTVLEDLNYLKSVGLVELEHGPFTLAKLTLLGEAVAQGTEHAAGVRRPLPGEE